jgi:hypothetical protein
MYFPSSELQERQRQAAEEQADRSRREALATQRAEVFLSAFQRFTEEDLQNTTKMFRIGEHLPPHAKRIRPVDSYVSEPELTSLLGFAPTPGYDYPLVYERIWSASPAVLLKAEFRKPNREPIPAGMPKGDVQLVYGTGLNKITVVDGKTEESADRFFSGYSYRSETASYHK